ncbi:hypothetical protein IE077_000731 [Cardiosporidium cionae]|uniref:Nuclear pore complex protein n=1 Tax=Cardiosporidium cionae TaxID=476202 RepID=A0ABQ7J6L0_9APIC|nr:hypothetical protein IE077_000731 [Cardiosporidium cionae]|eukprot:KAF8819641.1 hypothetical protein IE077_000731 [Cardiosporidium cionae]
MTAKPSTPFFHLDWIYQCTSQDVVSTDEQSLSLFYKKLWTFLRYGSLLLADRLVQSHRQFWLLEFLHANEAWLDPYSPADVECSLPSMEFLYELIDSEWILRPCLIPSGHTVKDLHILHSAAKQQLMGMKRKNLGRIGDGNKWRSLFKSIVKQMCASHSYQETSPVHRFSPYQPALYGYMAGDLTPLLRVSETYKDIMFAVIHTLKEDVIDYQLSQLRATQPSQQFYGEPSKGLSSTFPSNLEYNNASHLNYDNLEISVFESLQSYFNNSRGFSAPTAIPKEFHRSIYSEACESIQILQIHLILGQLNGNAYKHIYQLLQQWNSSGIIFQGQTIYPLPECVRQFSSYFTTVFDDLYSEESPLKPSLGDKDILVGAFVNELIHSGRATELFELFIEKVNYLSQKQKMEAFCVLLWREFDEGIWMTKNGENRLAAYILKLSLHFNAEILLLLSYLAVECWEFVKASEILKGKIQNHRERLRFAILCILLTYSTIYKNKSPAEVTHLSLVGCYYESMMTDPLHSSSLTSFSPPHPLLSTAAVSLCDFISTRVYSELYSPLLNSLVNSIGKRRPLPQCLTEDQLSFKEIEIFLRDEWHGHLLIGATPIPTEGIHQFIGLHHYCKLVGLLLQWKTSTLTSPSGKLSECTHSREFSSSSFSPCKDSPFSTFSSLRREELSKNHSQTTTESPLNKKLAKYCKKLFAKLRHGVFPTTIELSEKFGHEFFLSHILKLPHFCENVNTVSFEETQDWATTQSISEKEVSSLPSIVPPSVSENLDEKSILLIHRLRAELTFDILTVIITNIRHSSFQAMPSHWPPRGVWTPSKNDFAVNCGDVSQNGRRA